MHRLKLVYLSNLLIMQVQTFKNVFRENRLDILLILHPDHPPWLSCLVRLSINSKALSFNVLPYKIHRI